MKDAVAIALCAPAVRMVVVAVRALRRPDGTWEEDDCTICPVLALQAIHRQSSNVTDHDAIICHGEYGIWEAGEIFDLPTTEYRLVPCTWAPKDDHDRLAPIAAELRLDARCKADALRVKLKEQA